MATFLMCEPKYFEVRYVINPWMAGNEGLVDKALARRQWETLYDALSRRASIRLIEPVEGLPDMVFTANGGFVSRRREVIVPSFRHPERQPEAQYFRRFFETLHYRVIRINGALKFEGAGDALYDSGGQVWAGFGIRSNAEGIHEIAATLHLRVNELYLNNPRWYHLDTAFCPLANGQAIAYEKAFSTQSVIKINKGLGEKVIWISDEDAYHFSCNAVNIGNDVILNRASDALKAELGKRNFNVIEIDVSEFMKAGGACKCMTLELYEDAPAPDAAPPA
jgi:N-dimethylarginine dimethylaminohydrolase